MGSMHNAQKNPQLKSRLRGKIEEVRVLGQQDSKLAVGPLGKWILDNVTPKVFH